MEIQIFLRKSHFHETANINNSSNKPLTKWSSSKVSPLHALVKVHEREGHTPNGWHLPSAVNHVNQNTIQ